MTSRTSFTSRSAAALGVALILGLTACSPGSSDADSGLAATDQESPLDEFFGAVWGSDLSEEEMTRQHEDRSRRTEELVAQCMAEQGWEYVPNLANQGFVSIAEDVDWRPEDRDWVQVWGYGAVDSPWNSDGRRVEGDEMREDPNWEFAMSLTETERDAYWAALWGAPQDEENLELDADGNPIWDWNWEQAGCFGWAQHQVDSEESLWEAAEFAPLFEALDDFWNDFQTSPEVAALNLEWSNCMADAGHPGFSQQWDAQGSIFDEMNDIWNSFDWENWDYETGGDPSESPVIVNALAELGAREIELALIDLDCREATNFRQRETELRFAGEEQFVADHRQALEALRAAAEQSR